MGNLCVNWRNVCLSITLLCNKAPSTPATKSKATLSNATEWNVASTLLAFSATTSNEFCVLSTKSNKSNMFNFRQHCTLLLKEWCGPVADPGIVGRGMMYPVFYPLVSSLPPRPCPSRPLLSPAMGRAVSPVAKCFLMHLSKEAKCQA